MSDNHKFVLAIISMVCLTIMVLYGLHRSTRKDIYEDDPPEMDPKYNPPSTSLNPSAPQYKSEFIYSEPVIISEPARPKAPKDPNE